MERKRCSRSDGSSWISVVDWSSLLWFCSRKQPRRNYEKRLQLETRTVWGAGSTVTISFCMLHCEHLVPSDMAAVQLHSCPGQLSLKGNNLASKMKSKRLSEFWQKKRREGIFLTTSGYDETWSEAWSMSQGWFWFCVLPLSLSLTPKRRWAVAIDAYQEIRDMELRIDLGHLGASCLQGIYTSKIF